MWKFYLRRLAKAWFGKQPRQKARPGKPIGTRASLSLDQLEDRLLLSTSVPVLQFTLATPSPGLVQGLGTATGGAEAGSYTHHLVESGQNADQRFVLDVTARADFTLAGSAGTFSQEEDVTVSFTLQEATGPTAPLAVVNSGSATVTRSAAGSLAWYAFAGFGTEIPNYGPADLGLSTTGWAETDRDETFQLDSEAEDRAASVVGGTASGSFSYSWFGERFGQTVTATAGASGTSTLTSTVTGEGSNTYWYSGAGSFLPAGGVGGAVGDYSLAASQGSTFTADSTSTATYVSGTFSAGTLTQDGANSASASTTYSAAGQLLAPPSAVAGGSYTLATQGSGSTDNRFAGTQTYAGPSATLSGGTVTQTAGQSGSNSSTYTEAGTLTGAGGGAAAPRYSLATSQNNTNAGSSTSTGTYAGGALTSGTLTQGSSASGTSSATYTEAGRLLAPAAPVAGGSYSLATLSNSGFRKSGGGTLTLDGPMELISAGAASQTASSWGTFSSTRTEAGSLAAPSTAAGSASGTVAATGTAAAAGAVGPSYSLATSESNTFSTQNTQTANYASGTFTGTTLTQGANSSGTSSVSYTEAGSLLTPPSGVAGGSYSLATLSNSGFTNNGSGIVTLTGVSATVSAGAASQTATSWGTVSSTYTEAGSLAAPSATGSASGTVAASGTAVASGTAAASGTTGAAGPSYSLATSQSNTFSAQNTQTANYASGTFAGATLTQGASSFGTSSATYTAAGRLLAPAAPVAGGSYSLATLSDSGFTNNGGGTLTLAGASATASAGALSQTATSWGTVSNTYTEAGSLTTFSKVAKTASGTASASGTATAAPAALPSYSLATNQSSTFSTQNTQTANYASGTFVGATLTQGASAGGTSAATYTEAGRLLTPAAPIAGGSYSLATLSDSSFTNNGGALMTLAGPSATLSVGAASQTANAWGTLTSTYTETGSLTTLSATGSVTAGYGGGSYSGDNTSKAFTTATESFAAVGTVSAGLVDYTSYLDSTGSSWNGTNHQASTTSGSLVFSSDNTSWGWANGQVTGAGTTGTATYSSGGGTSATASPSGSPSTSSWSSTNSYAVSLYGPPSWVSTGAQGFALPGPAFSGSGWVGLAWGATPGGQGGLPTAADDGGLDMSLEPPPSLPAPGNGNAPAPAATIQYFPLFAVLTVGQTPAAAGAGASAAGGPASAAQRRLDTLRSVLQTLQRREGGLSAGALESFALDMARAAAAGARLSQQDYGFLIERVLRGQVNRADSNSGAAIQGAITNGLRAGDAGAWGAFRGLLLRAGDRIDDHLNLIFLAQGAADRLTTDDLTRLLRRIVRWQFGDSAEFGHRVLALERLAGAAAGSPEKTLLLLRALEDVIGYQTRNPAVTREGERAWGKALDLQRTLSGRLPEELRGNIRLILLNRNLTDAQIATGIQNFQQLMQTDRRLAWRVLPTALANLLAQGKQSGAVQVLNQLPSGDVAAFFWGIMDRAGRMVESRTAIIGLLTPYIALLSAYLGQLPADAPAYQRTSLTNVLNVMRSYVASIRPDPEAARLAREQAELDRMVGSMSPLQRMEFALELAIPMVPGEVGDGYAGC